MEPCLLREDEARDRKAVLAEGPAVAQVFEHPLAGLEADDGMAAGDRRIRDDHQVVRAPPEGDELLLREAVRLLSRDYLNLRHRRAPLRA